MKGLRMLGTAQRWRSSGIRLIGRQRGVNMSSITEPRFGAGIYSFPVAASIIGDDPRKLRRWMTSGLTPAEFGRGERGSAVLSFHDLISLEIVRRFRVEGVSLQAIRKLEARMRRNHPDIERPFATEAFFTDGANIWLRENPDDIGVLEMVGKLADDRNQQLSWKAAVQAFATEIRYEQGLAVEWRRGRWIHLDPRVQFGLPVIVGTRIPVDTIRENLAAASPATVADWYDLPLEAVLEVETSIAAA